MLHVFLKGASNQGRTAQQEPSMSQETLSIKTTNVAAYAATVQDGHRADRERNSSCCGCHFLDPRCSYKVVEGI